MLQVLRQDAEGAPELGLLDLVAAVEGDFFGVGDNAGVDMAEVAVEIAKKCNLSLTLFELAKELSDSEAIFLPCYCQT